MGVTIHFEGGLRDEKSYERVILRARAFAGQHNWKLESIDESQVTLNRIRNGEPWDYTGLTRGVVLYPHENCDPFRLEFDRNLYVQEYVKTQFAPVEVHVRVIELLRLLAPEFQAVEVEDEGDYWD